MLSSESLHIARWQVGDIDSYVSPHVRSADRKTVIVVSACSPFGEAISPSRHSDHPQDLPVPVAILQSCHTASTSCPIPLADAAFLGQRSTDSADRSDCFRPTSDS